MDELTAPASDRILLQDLRELLGELHERRRVRKPAISCGRKLRASAWLQAMRTVPRRSPLRSSICDFRRSASALREIERSQLDNVMIGSAADLWSSRASCSAAIDAEHQGPDGGGPVALIVDRTGAA